VSREQTRCVMLCRCSAASPGANQRGAGDDPESAGVCAPHGGQHSCEKAYASKKHRRLTHANSRGDRRARMGKQFLCVSNLRPADDHGHQAGSRGCATGVASEQTTVKQEA